MSTQTKEYIVEMKNMYEKISRMTVLTQIEFMFLIAYKKTIDNSIIIEGYEVVYE